MSYPFWCATRQPESAVDPGLGLVNGVTCNDCDLAEEGMEVVAFGKATVKSKEETACGGGNVGSGGAFMRSGPASG
eukprot:27396-Chlamydomonas_euryale.AAC.1